MSQQSNWLKKAICAKDKHPNKWISYNKDDIEYAKKGCARCSVVKQCLFNALYREEDVYSTPFIGVIAGISEYDYLIGQWEEDTGNYESNWRSNRTAL